MARSFRAGHAPSGRGIPFLEPPRGRVRWAKCARARWVCSRRETQQEYDTRRPSGAALRKGRSPLWPRDRKNQFLRRLHRGRAASGKILRAPPEREDPCCVSRTKRSKDLRAPEAREEFFKML